MLCAKDYKNLSIDCKSVLKRLWSIIKHDAPEWTLFLYFTGVQTFLKHNVARREEHLLKKVNYSPAMDMFDWITWMLWLFEHTVQTKGSVWCKSINASINPIMTAGDLDVYFFRAAWLWLFNSLEKSHIWMYPDVQ